MEGSGWNAQDVPATFQANNVKGLLPGQIDQKEGAAATGCQQIVLLMRMQIELPSSTFRIIGWTDRGTAVNHQVTGIGGVNGDIEKANRRCVPKPFIRQQLEHQSGLGQA